MLLFLNSPESGFLLGRFIGSKGRLPSSFVDSQIIEYDITLDIRVGNLGSALADDVHALPGFDASEGKIWNPVESLAFDLPVDQSVTITITLQAPPGKHTRLIIQIVDNDRAVDQSYSDCFDTRKPSSGHTGPNLVMRVATAG